MLGEDEWCCGSVLLRTGNRELAKEVAEHNVKMFKEAGVDEIITSCAGCYKTLKNDYPKLVGEFDIKVLSSPEYINKLVDEGRIKLKGSNTKVTFHDPCHMGRHSSVYDEPREVLTKIPGVELVEMPRNRENSRCCGSGGGVQSGFRELAHKMADVRIEEAADTGAGLVTTPCPFCTFALSQAAERTGKNIKVKDFAEFILDAVD
jgi:heterodisulfide reductase subunit D